MLSFGFIAAFWLLLLILPVIFFYFLRMRFKKQIISSTYLWLKFKNIITSGNKLHWRFILLLILQILIIIFAVFIFVKPFTAKQKLLKPGIVFILDVSASMASKDVSDEKKEIKNRLDLAKNILIQEIKILPKDINYTVFLCSSEAVKLADSDIDTAGLINKLKDINPENTGFSETEVSNNLQSWMQTTKRSWKAVLITDGGPDLGGQKLSETFTSQLNIITIGTESKNIGVSGLRLLSENNDNKTKVQFFIENGWETGKTIDLTLLKDNNILKQISINVPQGLSSNNFTISDKIEYGYYTLQIDNNKDNFDLDDKYYLAINPNHKIKVLYIGEKNLFLTSALKYNGIDFVYLEEFPAKFLNDTWDLVIVNKTSITNEIKCNLLAFDVIPFNSPVKFNQEVSGILKTSGSSHNLMRFIDWQDTFINKGIGLIIEPNVQALSVIDNVPVIACWENNGYRWTICSFDIFNSNIGLSGSFPIFIKNVLQWSAPQNDSQLSYTLNAGDTVIRAESSSWKIKDIKGTNNLILKRNGNLNYIKPIKSGIYEWADYNNTGYIAVNIPISEIDITPQNIIINNAKSNLAGVYSQESVSLEKPALILFLLTLFIEWIMWRGLPLFKKENK